MKILKTLLLVAAVFAVSGCATKDAVKAAAEEDANQTKQEITDKLDKAEESVKQKITEIDIINAK